MAVISRLKLGRIEASRSARAEPDHPTYTSLTRIYIEQYIY
jgi:hypothetical protein